MSVYDLRLDKKTVAGQGKSAGIAALAANPNIKTAIIVDDMLIFTMTAGYFGQSILAWKRIDLTLIPNALGSHLNPSAYGEVRDERGPFEYKNDFGCNPASQQVF